MMMSSLSLAEILTRTVSILLSNIILWWGFFRFVPEALNNFGFDYFDWKRYRRQGLIGGIFLLASANVIIAVLMRFTLAPLPIWAKPCLALVLVSLWGIWRVDRQFRLIPDRFHISGLIGATGFVAARIYLNPQIWPMQAIAIASGMLLPGLILGVNYLYTKYRAADGLGLGDIKALLWLPVLLGDQIWIAFAFACFIAAFVQAFGMLFRRKIDLYSPFAFGPYIVLAVVSALFTLG